ncbi:MAG: hypothetical protein LC808_36670 [Actinobacteria bacterium]|nr:hypothetical protein [Actinomycetota bacterium]
MFAPLLDALAHPGITLDGNHGGYAPYPDIGIRRICPARTCRASPSLIVRSRPHELCPRRQVINPSLANQVQWTNC